MWFVFVLILFGSSSSALFDDENYSKKTSFHLNSISSPMVVPLLSSFTLTFDVLALPMTFYNDTMRSKHSFFLLHNNHSLLFSFEIDQMTRVPSVSSPFMNCSFIDRLPSKRVQHLAIQMTVEESRHQLISLLFLNGILRNKCLESVNGTVMTQFDGLGELVDVEKNQSPLITVQNITYWPSDLSYPEIRAISSLTSATPPQTCEAETPEDSSEYLSKTLILLWPSYYSLASLQRRSEEWQAQHLSEYLALLIQDLRSSSSPLDKNLYQIVVPSSSSLSQRLVNQVNSLSSLDQSHLCLTFLNISHFSADPYPSYPQYINFIYDQLQTNLFDSHSLDSLNGFLSWSGDKFRKHWSSESAVVILLSSHVLPKLDLVAGLRSEISAAAKGAIVGGTILNTRDEIENYGFEFYELSYAGGLDTYLVPHARYRSAPYSFSPLSVSLSVCLSLSLSLSLS
jgi:hypothetical protein